MSSDFSLHFCPKFSLAFMVALHASASVRKGTEIRIRGKEDKI
jgi:hypothetical protein